MCPGLFDLSSLILKPFNRIINTALALDPESLEKIALLSGKLLAVEWRALNTTVYIYLHAEGVTLSFQSSKVPDALFSSNTPLSMLKLLMAPEHRDLGGEVSIQGDVHLAQQLQHIFSGLSIDWEEQLAKFVGDGAAVNIGKAASDFQQWSKNMAENISLNTTEFLQQETQHLPSRLEVDDFLKDVDQLRNDVERAAVRLKQLEAQ